MKIKELTKRDLRKLLEDNSLKEIKISLFNVPVADGDILPFKEISKSILNMIQNTLVIDNFKLVKNKGLKVYVKDNVRCTCSSTGVTINKY